MTAEDAAILKEILADPALSRILCELRRLWETYGRSAGRIVVESRDEAVALGGLLGKRPQVGKSVDTSTLEHALLHGTRFGCTLREALELHFDTQIVTRAERRELRERAWRETLAALQRTVEAAHLEAETREALSTWLVEEKADFRRRHNDRDRLLREFALVVRAIEQLPKGDNVCALAVLANSVAGDPKAFDAGAPAAGLFDLALARLHPEVETPLLRGAEGRDELLTAARIAKDRTSPKVDVFGLLSVDRNYAHLRQQPVATFSLRALEMMGGGHLRAAGGIAFVVENPPVYDQLVERLLRLPPERRPTLVCTNGQLNLADRRLLRELVAGGAGIRYAGDFDPAGLRIASVVLRLFCSSAELWRMSPDDYARTLRPDSQALILAEIPHLQGPFGPLVRAMSEAGKVGYQEALLEHFADDLSLAFSRAN